MQLHMQNEQIIPIICVYKCSRSLELPAHYVCVCPARFHVTETTGLRSRAGRQSEIDIKLYERHA